MTGGLLQVRCLVFFVSQTTKVDKRIEMEAKKEKNSIFFTNLNAEDVFF